MLAFFCGNAAYDTHTPVSYVTAAHWSSALQAFMHCGNVNRASCWRIACLAAGLAAYPVRSSKFASPSSAHRSAAADHAQPAANSQASDEATAVRGDIGAISAGTDSEDDDYDDKKIRFLIIEKDGEVFLSFMHYRYCPLLNIFRGKTVKAWPV